MERGEKLEVRDMLVKPEKKEVKGEGRGILSPLTSYLLPLCLILAGAILLILTTLAGKTSNNLVLLVGLLLIIVGIVLHVKLAKSGEKY